MTSKVLVKLPVVPFQQRKKLPAEIAPLQPGGCRNAADGDEGRFQGYTADKVTQLEQNIKFLQEQHQTTLLALHQEVEVLRQRNRDLQFQLVFAKGPSSFAASSPSSPEDCALKAKGSPAAVNVAPLQVELLERELQELRAELSEARARNICLSEAAEKHKQKLELADKSKSRDGQRDAASQADGWVECREVELQARLDDAEGLLKRLRLESEDQRKQICSLKSAASGGPPPRQHYQHAAPSASAEHDEPAAYHKFPPLHTQSYWHRGSSARTAHSYAEHKAAQSDYRRGASRQQQQQQQQQSDDAAASGMLPQLQNGSASYPPLFRQQTHHNGGNYHRDEQQSGFRKYRGKKSRKDFNGQDRRAFQQQHQPYEQSPACGNAQQRAPLADSSLRAPRRHQS